MYPEADIPVLQLSLPTNDPDTLIEIGRRLRVVRDEDYFTCSRIQRALAAGAKEHVVFGRNEEPCQLFHRWVDALVAADSDAAFDRLFAQGLPSQGLPV